ncbi:MAG: DUF6686 family protein [Bacteroidota bacterium]
MCQKSQYLTLTETENCQINYCKLCKTFSIAYKTCCASFTAAELSQFVNVLENLTEKDFIYDFMGNKTTIVKNSMAFIGFCLTQDDVAYLIQSIRESETLFDAFQIIYN